MNARTKDRLSKATLYATLNSLKRFFVWLAGGADEGVNTTPLPEPVTAAVADIPRMGKIEVTRCKSS
jgi:hypothetical protein